MIASTFAHQTYTLGISATGILFHLHTFRLSTFYIFGIYSIQKLLSHMSGDGYIIIIIHKFSIALFPAERAQHVNITAVWLFKGHIHRGALGLIIYTDGDGDDYDSLNKNDDDDDDDDDDSLNLKSDDDDDDDDSLHLK